MGSRHVPPSQEDPATGVATTDVAATAVTPAVRLHLPKLTSPPPPEKLPILLYFHGGGFCVESAFSFLHHRYTTTLSAAATAVVVSVEYRLAPEHPLPAAYDDAWAALTWIAAGNNHPWIAGHGDLTRLFVGGDSAGGNIAHNLLIRAGSEPLPGSVKIAGAILCHPFFWGSNPIGTEPRENVDRSFCYRLWKFVFPAAEGGIDCPMINPVGGGSRRLAGLGCRRLAVCVAEKDVLAGRAVAYAAEVRESGWEGEVEVENVAGEEHCFQVDNPATEKAGKLIAWIADFIRRCN
ncbi:2-hydroxyisoflavanone dehydratase-like [Andrographis paniculata]|uniref:2-hydroxyisoflavanone dehydratase-like n=1 Tax=Andrographis paniculata TaxID=175694 RepID=UPI0021E6F182|nr:2-hydroxyisoflavanone dehydratase-like [Andrographis paniculata]